MGSKRVLWIPVILAALGQVSHAGLVAYWNLEEGAGSATKAVVGSPQADGRLVGATWVTVDLAPSPAIRPPSSSNPPLPTAWR